MVSSLPAWTARWCAAAVAWIVLTDSRRASELIVGAGVAALAGTITMAIRRPGAPRPLSGLARVASLGPRRLARPAARLFADTWVLALSLARTLAGRPPASGLLLGAYRPGRARSTAAGRAVTEIWGSLGPNRYVIGVDEESGTILVHELVPGTSPADPLAR
jgi:hypothetical protein